MNVKHVFIDDGGVLNNNARRGKQWATVVGVYMANSLGGSEGEWREANLRVFPLVWSNIQSQQISEFDAFYRKFCSDWLRAMTRAVGRGAEVTDARELYKPLSLEAGKLVDAAIEHAATCVGELSTRAHLHMASGTASWELEAILTRMGIKDNFLTLYGPDVTNVNKIGPEFYSQIFAHAGLSPQECIVIESSEEACQWALQAGAQVVHVDIEGGGQFSTLQDAMYHITNIL